MSVIKIDHCTEKEFITLFRNDLAMSMASVIIFSPFISKNRIATYYQVFNSIDERDVSIYILIKHKE